MREAAKSSDVIMVKPSSDEAATLLLVERLRAEQERLLARISRLTASLNAQSGEGAGGGAHAEPKSIIEELADLRACLDQPTVDLKRMRQRIDALLARLQPPQGPTERDE